jgi:hypothetical protein
MKMKNSKTIMLNEDGESGGDGKETAQVGGVADWPQWTPVAAVAWSLVYAALGLFWLISGQDSPFTTGGTTMGTGPLVEKVGSTGTWIIVLALGIPAAALALAMLRNARRFRLLLIIAGAMVSVILLLFMSDFTMLVMLAYIPIVVFKLVTNADVSFYTQELTRSGWSIAYQLLCLTGGFIWLGATVSYARRSCEACMYCGRRDGPEEWTSPERARQWGRLAVYLSMVVPVFYAATRYAWALGIPLGMTEAYLRSGQEAGTWISGLFLANVGLAGALLTLGLIKRWGEVFPRWIPRLAGHCVPMALAIVPAAIISVLLVVTGITIWSSYSQMADAAANLGLDVWINVGPTLLFPFWGVALAVATLGYYYRRRGPCGKCGRGQQ